MEAKDRWSIVSSRNRHVKRDAVSLYASVLDTYRHEFAVAPRFCFESLQQHANRIGNADRSVVGAIIREGLLAVNFEYKSKWTKSFTGPTFIEKRMLRES